jgi:hypothetical protein
MNDLSGVSGPTPETVLGLDLSFYLKGLSSAK